jgi:hypothetical protein
LYEFHPEKKTTQAIGDTGPTVLLFAVTIGAESGPANNTKVESMKA